MSPKLGLIIIGIALVGLVIAISQISPRGDDKADSVNTLTDLPVPLLNSTEALTAWHCNPLNNQQSENPEGREQLIQAWNDFCGRFSPLPKFDELPATFRIRTLAAGHGEGTGFTIVMNSEWDAETIAEKLRPFRNRLNSFAAHRVDIDRLDNGVLVETHEMKPTGKIYILRHASWVIATNSETNISVLAKAAIEQTPDKKEDITPATYSVLSDILKSYEIDKDADESGQDE